MVFYSLLVLVHVDLETIVLWESHRRNEGWSDLNAFHYITLQKMRGRNTSVLNLWVWLTV